MTNTQPGTLILLRHGESQWNASNQFTGWVDVPLTEKGQAEAAHAGKLIKNSGLKPVKLYTSLLRRAINTANLALDIADRPWIPVVRDWRLNERHYGKLQGLNKAQIRAQFGDEQFMQWRRSYDTPPPPIDPHDQYSQTSDERYATLAEVPVTECLQEVVHRLVPYYLSTIEPELKQGNTILVAAHGNSLRALVKYLDNIADVDIAELNIPTGIPLVYYFNQSGGKLTVSNPGGTYLDPEAALAGAAAVASQGAQK